MTIGLENIKEINSQKIRKALEYQVPIEVTSYTVPKSMEIYIRELLSDFLTISHHEQKLEYLTLCLGELLTNAKKANTKRVYFKEKGLDIDDISQYEQGIKTFKDDTFSNINHYLELQKKAGLYVKMRLRVKSDSSFLFEIKNNSRLTVIEKQRILEKMNSVKDYSSIADVMISVVDQTEGAGLGIIIMILMLEKMGLSRDNFQIYDEDGNTITRIFLPCDYDFQVRLNNLYKNYAMGLKRLPVSQKNYEKLQTIISSGCNKADLINLINNDPVLAAMLLSKNENSYSSISISEKVHKISEAELKKLFPENPSDNIEIHLVSNQQYDFYLSLAGEVALCAFVLGKNTPDSQIDSEELYTLGLFSLLGRVLYSGTAHYLKNLVDLEFAQTVNEDSSVQDIYNTETNFAMLGYGFLSSKKLPEKYLNILEKCSLWDEIFEKKSNFNSPESIIAAAQMLTYYDAGEIEFYQIEQNVLSACNFENELQLKDFLSKLHEVL